MPRWLKPKKDVEDGDTRRGVVNKWWSNGFRMEKSLQQKCWGSSRFIGKEGNPGKWNISVPGGKKIERDSVSSGERTRKSLNPDLSGGCRVLHNVLKKQKKVKEWTAKEGESPVFEI